MSQSRSNLKSRVRNFSFLALILMVQLALPMAAPSRLLAQNREFPDRINRQFFRYLLKDTGTIIASPFRWDSKDCWRAGLSAVATGSFLLADNSIHCWVIDHPDKTRTSAARVFSAAGTPVALLGLASAGYLTGCFSNSSQTRKAFLFAAESLIITGLITGIIKTGAGRSRPYNEEGAFSFHPFTLKERWRSFPSGHAASAWALASSLAESSRNIGLDILFYTLATGVSISRVMLDKHFASDVVAGSLLGFFIGKRLTRASQPCPTGTAFQFIINRRVVAATLVYNF